MDDRDRFSGFDPQFDYKYPTSSKTSPNRKPQEYEGVEYIPSGYPPPEGGARKSRPPYYEPGRASGRGYPEGGARRQEGRPRGAAGPGYGGGSPRGGQGGRSKTRVKAQSQSALYMALIVAAGVIFCVGAFFLMYNLMSPKSPVKTNTPSGTEITSNGEPTGGTAEREPAATQADAELAGIISAISVSGGTVTIVNAEDDQITDIYVNAQTQYRNKYGQAMTLSQFGEGDIVIAEYDSLNKKAAVVRQDPEAWAKTSIKNVEINIATTTVKISNDTYGVSKNALFLPAGTEPSVKTSDTVTIKGRKQKILAVIVEKRTGTIEFTNKDKITDGTVEVDSDIYKALEETGSLKISTGTHTVVVKGANIEVFIKEITVKEGETLVIDLAEAQMKEGVINLTVNEPDYSLYVNEELVARTSEPLKLPFGTYKLKVSKEGFASWEDSVTVNQPTIAVTASLAEEVKMGKITVTTDPEFVNGSVYIDNALLGVAPIYRVNVTYGTHQLTVTAPGYVGASHTIIVEGDSSYNVIMHPAAADTGSTGNTGGTIDTGNTGNTGDTGYLDNTGGTAPADYSNIEW